MRARICMPRYESLNCLCVIIQDESAPIIIDAAVQEREQKEGLFVCFKLCVYIHFELPC